MRVGYNLQTIKQENRASILYLLNEKGPQSRKQIAEALGLTKAALSKITADLIEEGVISETEAVGSGVGRKEILLSLSFGKSAALCINFERFRITLSVASLDGRLLDTVSMDFTEDFTLVKSRIKEYYGRVKSYFSIIGAGVSIIGEAKEYGIYKDISIKEEMEEILPVPVFVKNNVRAFSLAEIIYGDRHEEKNVLVFKWGPGIGSSFIREGKVLSGDDFGNAEIGHVIVKPTGKVCRCGRTGCLETETALDVIKEDVKILGYDMSIGEILSSEDKNILALFDEKINMVCLALLNACTILNSSTIVLFGSVFKNEAFLKRFLNKWAVISSPIPVTMVTSKLNAMSDYIGSCAIVARKLFFEKNV